MPSPRLKKSLSEGRFIFAPGIYDGVSARVADKAGFEALYMTGYGVSASLLGKPDAGYLTATHMADRVRTFCSVIDTPLIADADTGFGGLVNVEEAVRAYEQAGVSAIQLEDQQFPKRCGHTKNRTVIDIEDAKAKIKIAVDSRDSTDFLIIARTDARTSLGLDEALRRAETFLSVGADIIFVESPESVEELETISKSLNGCWLLANMVDGGRTPILPKEQLIELGFHVAIHPVAALQAVAATLSDTYSQFASEGRSTTKALGFDALSDLVGFQDVWALDDQFNKAK